MTDVAPGVATGRSCRTYYHVGTRRSGTLDEFSVVSWIEIAFVSGSESFDPGKMASIVGELRSEGRKFQASGAQDKFVLKFRYQRPRGITDAVFTALLASYIAGGTTPEFAVMDDDIENVGALGWRGYGKVVQLEHVRDLDKYVEYAVTVEERTTWEVQVAGGDALPQELLPWEVPAPA